jgi:hypothetical protein
MFLRISADEYVNTEEIISIKGIDAMTCSLSTAHDVHIAEYPLDTLMAILRNEEPKKEDNAEVLKSIDHKIGELPIFAG